MQFTSKLHAKVPNFTCENIPLSHVIQVWHTSDTHANIVFFTCENLYFWGRILQYFRMRKPIFFTCELHVNCMWNLIDYMWKFIFIYMRKNGFHMWRSIFRTWLPIFRMWLARLRMRKTGFHMWRVLVWTACENTPPPDVIWLYVVMISVVFTCLDDCKGKKSWDTICNIISYPL